MIEIVNVAPLCYRRVKGLADRPDQESRYQEAYNTALPVIHEHLTNKAVVWGWLSHTFAIEQKLWYMCAHQKPLHQFRYVFDFRKSHPAMDDTEIMQDFILGSAKAMRAVENWLCHMPVYPAARLVTTMAKDCAVTLLGMNVGFKEIENELVL